jgi:hypothetical protein
MFAPLKGNGSNERCDGAKIALTTQLGIVDVSKVWLTQHATPRQWWYRGRSSVHDELYREPDSNNKSICSANNLRCIIKFRVGFSYFHKYFLNS